VNKIITADHTAFTRHAAITQPIICGPMYPCSNPELVAAVSQAGGLGVIQPLSLTYVHGYEFAEGLRYIRDLTQNPVGMNALIEKSSRRYHQRMMKWIDIALEQGVRFFITSMGKPDWVVEQVHAVGGVVYHDATERKWALKGLEAGADGIIAVNNRAGGHAGGRSAQQLFEELSDLSVPLICAGGVGQAGDYQAALAMGYAGVQMGTRFIASEECQVVAVYKNALLKATDADIVLTECVSGTPVAVIHTPYIERLGLKAGPIARWMLRRNKLKYLMRTLYMLRSLWQLKRAIRGEAGAKDFWQAGKSVAGIHSVKPVGEIMREFTRAGAGDSRR